MINKFVFIYIDDILIFSKTMQLTCFMSGQSFSVYCRTTFLSKQRNVNFRNLVSPSLNSFSLLTALR